MSKKAQQILSRDFQKFNLNMKIKRQVRSHKNFRGGPKFFFVPSLGLFWGRSPKEQHFFEKNLSFKKSLPGSIPD